MGSVDGSDELTFRVNFSGDGAAKLKEKVMDKLKEFMGDYTDDTLVEYVIVLLRNGRQKEEARNELNVFLGDDSHSFVAWLWDHLSSNLNLYVEPKESNTGVAVQMKPSEEHFERNDLCHLDSPERIKSNKLRKGRHNREWKGLTRNAAEPPPLRSSEIDNIHAEEKTRNVGRRSISPQPLVHRKRSRPDERLYSKNGAVSQSTIKAPRRLLQSAVRDAVGSSRPSNISTEPTLKRLCSAVSTSTGGSSLIDRPRRIQSIVRIPNQMATAIKAVAEAAEDVSKFKSSGSVFDRLSRGMGLSESSTQEYGEPYMEYGVSRDVNPILHQTISVYREGDYEGNYAGDMAMSKRDTGLTSDSASENEGYDKVNTMGSRVAGISKSGTSAGSNGTNNPRKIVNISVNVNTWKSPHFNQTREVAKVDGSKSVQERAAGAEKSSVRIVEDNELISVGNGNSRPALDNRTESQKTSQAAPGLYATRSLEDADSRTIFISNVNFGATKDSLTRHFNKFGDVLKVVIVADAATGQPKGSAFVEFMHKESADNALSLDGTSFMSRIMKVVKKNSAHQETVANMTLARGSPYGVARFPRVPFPRGAFRPRLPMRPCARSLQWKRDADVNSGAPNAIPSPTTRNFTYVRTEPKQDCSNSGST